MHGTSKRFRISINILWYINNNAYILQQVKKIYINYLFRLLSAIGSFVCIQLFGHVRQRVEIWRNPWAYAQDQGYQIVQGLYSISSGGMFGSGLRSRISRICTS